jgi:hypothetical protein
MPNPGQRPHALATRPRALKPSGVTGACRNYTALVTLGASPTLERTPYHYLLRVPLPGVLRYTLKVHLKDDTLIVSGRWEGTDASGAVCYGSVYRAAPLPPDAIAAGVETSLEADTLTVAVPHRP